ncbi:MAG: TatD family hydrolase [Elusimicrobia bacterium]|nr:TatD family hydrolase [Elusimicrobiota bacterium]
MLFDTHAHLSDPQFDADRDDVVRRAQDAGVTTLVEIADAPADWERALALSRRYPEAIRCSLGLHPYHADQWSEELGRSLPEKARLEEVVAIGEIGLDYNPKCGVAPDVQKRSFERMLDLAWACGKPVVLHCRDAYADMMPILENFYARKPIRRRYHGVLHCFSGGVPEALKGVSLGFALGVDGPVTYPKNDPLRAALKAAGIECIVLETDSPYLPPQSSRGKRNEPAALREIAAKLAAVFGTDAETIARETTRNGLRLFSLPE